MEKTLYEKDDHVIENKVEQKVQEVADELQVNLPKVNIPITLKLIALFTLIGGLSIIGSLFSDIIRPIDGGYAFYFLRIIFGVISIVIAWAILERRRLAIWLYGIIAFIGFFTNPVIAILPVIVAFYLYLKRDYFTPSIFDYAITYVVESIKILINKYYNRT
jgi:hypothetical protein